MESLELNDAYVASQGAEFDSLTTQDMHQSIMVIFVGNVGFLPLFV
jgi:hypothetical protein